MPAPDDYRAGRDPYIDPRTGILKNVPNLSSEAELASYEAILFQAQMLEAVRAIKSRKIFSFDDWREVHRLCFADVYEWAGQPRSIRIYKGNTAFAYPENIEAESARYFEQINAALAARTLTPEQAVIIFCEMNVIHPFRDGNGRTQRIVFEEIFARIGLVTDWSKCTQAEMIAAMQNAYHGDYQTAMKLFKRITG